MGVWHILVHPWWQRCSLGLVSRKPVSSQGSLLLMPWLLVVWVCRQRGRSLRGRMWNSPELGRGPSLYQFIPCICNPCLFCTTEDVLMCLMKTSFPPCCSSLGEREGERMKKGRGRDEGRRREQLWGPRVWASFSWAVLLGRHFLIKL